MNKNWELIKSSCTHRSDFIGSGAILLESIFDVVDQLSQLLSRALGYVLRLLSFHMSWLCFLGRLLALLLQRVHLGNVQDSEVEFRTCEIGFKEEDEMEEAHDWVHLCQKVQGMMVKLQTCLRFRACGWGYVRWKACRPLHERVWMVC